MSEQHESAWRKSLDDYLTRSDDPGRLERSNPQPRAYRCLQCAWTGRNMSERMEHYWATEHRICREASSAMTHHPR
jgi:hypothetical protein